LRGRTFGTDVPAASIGALELLAWRAAAAGETAIVILPAGKGRSLVGVYACGQGEVEEVAAPAMVDDDEVPSCVLSLENHGGIAITPSTASTGLRAAALIRGIELRVPAPGEAF